MSNNEWADSDCEFLFFYPGLRNDQHPCALAIEYIFFFKKILLVTTVAGPVIIEICGQGPRHRPPLCGGGGPPRLLSSALGREEAIIEF